MGGSEVPSGNGELAVLLYGVHVADLESSRGRLRLSYLPAAVTPISVRFPTSSNTYSGADLGHWLSGLLPDNQDVLDSWSRRLRLPGTDPFTILSSEMGHDCAGAVQFCRHEDISKLQSRAESIEELSDSDMRGIVTDLAASRVPRDPSGRAHRYSLSGAQAKIALCPHGGNWALPSGAQPSTHILKPEQSAKQALFPDMPLNEHLCLATASLLGLRASHTKLMEMYGVQVLVVQRYDRWTDADGNVLRIHQEDLCQAAGIMPSDKYEDDGGPAVEDITKIIKLTAQNPLSDIQRYADALLYNWIICGTDAHSKNYSLLHGLNLRSTSLAPLYDVASSMPYADSYAEARKWNLAQRIGKATTFQRADYRSQWERAAKILGIPERVLMDRARDLASRTPACMAEAIDALPTEYERRPLVRNLLEMVRIRSRDCTNMPARR